MIVLGFDTATSSTAVALRLSDGRTREARDDPPSGAHPGHATRLLDLARGLLEDAGVGWDAIGRLAAGTGPGTFTGLRVGIATARALAQSLSVPVVGISSLQALAQAALADAARSDATPADAAQRAGAPAPVGVLAVIDARRGEVFTAAYERGDHGVPRELTAPLALAPEKLGRVLTRAGRSTGAPRRWLAVGDGALRFRNELDLPGLEMAADRSPLHLVSAATICELALRAVEPGGHQQLLPDYRRRPDAELALEAASTGGGR